MTKGQFSCQHQQSCLFRNGAAGSSQQVSWFAEFVNIISFVVIQNTFQSNRNRVRGQSLMLVIHYSGRSQL
ncbi:hypothetical protein ACET3Z_002247 [Daucus carota]